MGRRLSERRKQKKKKKVMGWSIGLGVLILAIAVFTTVQRKSRINPELIEVYGQPAIRVDQEKIDFGYKTWNTNLTFAISVTNVGDQPLRFSETPYVEVLEGC